MIVEEILRQRLEGIKNASGVYVTPAFPKLVYVLDENNCLRGGKYDYITELAVKCSAKRMYPDYISAKKMKENYEGNVFAPMGCRSFLAPWKDENGEYKFEGRFNQGVVSLNLPQIGILAKGDEEKFWQLLEERLDLCYEALMCRHNALKGIRSDVSPVHWQHGAIARLQSGETIDRFLYGGYSTISLGYIGLYELTYLMKGVSQTDPVGEEFAVRVMKHLRETCDRWKKETNIGFALYGTPAESLCYRFARIDKERFGTIPNVTDKGYYTNSYHVDVREDIDAFSKFDFESQFQSISSGGSISYVEIPNMNHNLTALAQVVQYIYDHIQYAEFNTKSDYCQVCGYDGEILINDDFQWECPNCGNKDQTKMNVTRRTCGYLGENFWNEGKTKEIKSRVMHL
jgi:ribonucleoside-triphosphate reductase